MKTTKAPNPSKGENGEMSGILQKMGALNRSWKERWFVLESGKLYYYRHAKSPSPISSFSVEQSFVRHTPDHFPDTPCFDIVTPNRIFQLLAPSHNDMEKWMSMIEPYSAILKDNEVIKNVEQTIHKLEREKSLSLLNCQNEKVSRNSLSSKQGGESQGSPNLSNCESSQLVNDGSVVREVDGAEIDMITRGEDNDDQDVTQVVFSQEFSYKTTFLERSEEQIGSSIAVCDIDEASGMANVTAS